MRSSWLGLAALCAGLAPVPSLGQVGAARIEAGANHTCAITTALAGVKCWGSNTAGELGDGTTTARNTPVDVLGLTNGVAAIALGDAHTCALTEAGGVRCWGNNFHGQLGNPGITQTHSLAPVEVFGLGSGVRAIAAGAAHTCALTSHGGVVCWGHNLYGQLGDASNMNRRVPVEVAGLRSGVTSIGLGRNHSCAVIGGGEALCWGNNPFGQIGAPRTDSNIPRIVPGMESGTVAIAGGDDHSCALTTAGAAKCWGAGALGQLGYGAVGTPSTAPSVVPGLAASVVSVASYRNHTCATTSGGSVKCWGWNGSGQLGDATTAMPQAPVDVAGISGASALAVGADHSCAIVTGGAVRCWGNNFWGQLGDGTATTRLLQVGVADFADGRVTNLPGSYTGLFWNPAESGWGLHVTQRGPMVFAAWFTYDSSGRGRWFVASACRFDAVDARLCEGTLYETQGSGYLGTHFSPAVVNTTNVGELELTFHDRDRVRIRYGLRGNARTVELARMALRTGAVPAVDYTDLWWNPAESGWGLGIAHQRDVMFLSWFVYDASGQPLWYVAPDCRAGASGCAGELYRTRGPAIGPTFDPAQVQVTHAGSVEVTFSDASNGTIRYSADGVSGTKAITRQLF